MTDVYLKSVLKRLHTSAATADAVDGFQAFVTPEEARALLAHSRAQDAENARLRDALAAVCEACTKIATFEPGGELSFDRWDRGHRAGWRMAAKIAKQALEDTTAARALLDGGA